MVAHMFVITEEILARFQKTDEQLLSELPRLMHMTKIGFAREEHDIVQHIICEHRSRLGASLFLRIWDDLDKEGETAKKGCIVRSFRERITDIYLPMEYLPIHTQMTKESPLQRLKSSATSAASITVRQAHLALHGDALPNRALLDLSFSPPSAYNVFTVFEHAGALPRCKPLRELIKRRFLKDDRDDLRTMLSRFVRVRIFSFDTYLVLQALLAMAQLEVDPDDNLQYVIQTWLTAHTQLTTFLARELSWSQTESTPIYMIFAPFASTLFVQKGKGYQVLEVAVLLVDGWTKRIIAAFHMSNLI